MLLCATGKVGERPNDFLLYSGKDYETICEKARRDGFSGIEMHILDSGRTDRKALHAALDANGLQLVSIGTGSIYAERRWSLSDPDTGVRQACIRHLEKHMETAAAYGALVILGCVQGRKKPEDDLHDHCARMMESLHILDEMAEKYGILLGFEIMNIFESDAFRTIADGVVMMRREQFRAVRLHLDTVHMNIEERNIGEAICSAAGLIGHIHLSDNNREYPGSAHYDFDETMQALRKTGYHGALALEISPYPDEETAAKRSIAYMKRWL